MKRALAAVRRARSNLLELAGFGLLVAAAWQFGTTAGLAAAGIALVVIGLGTSE